MAWNLGTEYVALNGEGEAPLVELPTVKSMLRRAGIGADSYLSSHARLLDWQPFLTGQISRIGGASIPYFLVQLLGYKFTPDYYTNVYTLSLGAIVFAVGLLGLFFLRHKLLTATALLAGWDWAIPLRGSAGIHSYETLYHSSIPLVCFSLVLLGIRRLSHGRLMAAPVVAATGVFVLSSIQMGRVDQDAAASELREAVIADFERIQEIVPSGHSVFLMGSENRDIAVSTLFGGAAHMADYYLAGRTIESGGYQYDFLVTRQRIDIPALVTPKNRHLFLYHGIRHHELMDAIVSSIESKYETIVSGKPADHGVFDLYSSTRENTLTYVREPCSLTDMNQTFFLHIIPEDVHDVPLHSRRFGFVNYDFSFNQSGARFDGKCLATIRLPDYAIAGIRTGVEFSPHREED